MKWVVYNIAIRTLSFVWRHRFYATQLNGITTFRVLFYYFPSERPVSNLNFFFNNKSITKRPVVLYFLYMKLCVCRVSKLPVFRAPVGSEDSRGPWAPTGPRGRAPAWAPWLTPTSDTSDTYPEPLTSRCADCAVARQTTAREPTRRDAHFNRRYRYSIWYRHLRNCRA